MLSAGSGRSHWAGGVCAAHATPMLQTGGKQYSRHGKIFLDRVQHCISTKHPRKYKHRINKKNPKNAMTPSDLAFERKCSNNKSAASKAAVGVFVLPRGGECVKDASTAQVVCMSACQRWCMPEHPKNACVHIKISPKTFANEITHTHTQYKTKTKHKQTIAEAATNRCLLEVCLRLHVHYYCQGSLDWWGQQMPKQNIETSRCTAGKVDGVRCGVDPVRYGAVW